MTLIKFLQILYYCIAIIQRKVLYFSYSLYFYLKMNDYQVTKLRKQLQRKQQLLKEQRQDRQISEKRLVQVQAQRDRFHSELVIARQTIENVDLIIAQNIKEMKVKLEQENAESFNELQRLKDKLQEEKLLREKMEEEIRNKETVISQLSLRLREMSRKYKDPSLMVNTKDIADQAAITNNNFYKLTEKYNKICADMENVMAQNKILRKLHGVPQNFGFDLEEIKIAEKQQLEDYKAQCRKLQSEIEQLQAERTQLRYRLRQYNTLYSNKGERYKDMNQKQLELLDLYAMNLKDGKIELPEIDKSQKEMQREIIKLKAKIEVLQNKNPMPIMNQRQNVQGQNTQRLSIQALKKLQEQFSKLINPLREDMKKITDMNYRPNQQYNSKYQVINNQNQNVNISVDPSYRPPMPLPHSHNDWTHIKEGFSYLYNSKIPIDLKDMTDEAGFNIAKAKYEVAALQLQNIESLKLLKEKQQIQNKLSKQVMELRGKYEKCLKVQDNLFLRYFKEKEQISDRIRKLEIEKNTIINEKQQAQISLQIVKKSFDSLTKKTDLEKNLSEYTARLSISEAEVMKLKRRYDVLNDEHTLLRKNYTDLQGKTSANEYLLKQKLAYCKKNEKELTFFINKILDDVKDCVPGDLHASLLNRMQSLNDKNMNNSIKQTELRLRINRLENIQRQINLKDDIIQTLRDDNFDINMELQIIKNRLESVDTDYKTFQNIFRKLIKFINQNNISMTTYFKKFDRDGSGQSTKNEFLSAIKALGFEITNNQFELLFAQFDLDGSQSITYKQFLRKLRRSGVFTRNKEEEGLYRLFRAIKQGNISIKKAFQIIDKDGANAITKPKMETAFKQIGIDITMQTIDYIFKICDDDQNGTINCSQFQKLFDDIIRESAIEEKQVFSAQLDWKHAFVLKMQEISTKYHKGGLKQTFSTLDDDGSSCLSINQLIGFFTKAGIQIPKKQLLELFEFMDRHRDGKVQYIEFLKLLQEARGQKKRIDRLRYIKARTQQLRKQNQVNKQVQKTKISEQKSLNIKLMSLQTKHTSLLKKNDKLIKSVVTKEQEVNDLKKEIEQLQENIHKIQDQYYKEKQNAVKFQQKSRNRISEEQSKKITLENNQLKIRHMQVKNQLQTYKNLFQSLSNKNKHDEMRVVKIQSEVAKYYELVKQFQSNSDLNAEMGKKVYELQLSKRNEEVVYKKYDQIVEQLRIIQAENMSLSEQSHQKERQIINAHFFMQEKAQLMQRSIDDLNSKILPTVNPKRIEQILLKIRQISNSKSQLEKENKQLQQLNFNIQVRNDFIQNERVHIEQLQKKLRRTYTDESSVTIIDLTKKLAEFRMAQLKAKREVGLLKEKQGYYLRVNNTHIENIKQIEEQLANWEKKYNERQQFWRKRLSDQMKLMEDLQKQTSKTKQQQRKAEMFFKEQQIQERKIQEKFDSLPEEKQTKLSSIIRRRPDNQGQNAVFQLKAKINELQQELIAKEKEIYQLKTSLKQIVPQARLTDFAGQMTTSTTNFLMQTELSTSQLRNNARRFINNQKDQQNYYKQQALKLQQAAQQSIDTLQRIIDDKNDQLKRKQQIIDNLKKQLLKSKEQDFRQMQHLNEQIRQLRTKLQNYSLNEMMSRPTKTNFYPGKNGEESLQLRKIIDKKDEEIRNIQQKYDKLFISKEKKNTQVTANSQRILERKLEDLQIQRDIEKKRYLENQQKLNNKIKNLEKLSKEKDVKLTKLQKTLLDLKNYAVNESSKIENNQVQQQIKDAIVNLTKGKTANDSKMQTTLQKSLQTVQQLNKKNKEYQHQVKRLKQDKLSKTTYKK